MNEMEKAVADVIINAMRARDVYNGVPTGTTLDYAMETLGNAIDRWARMALDAKVGVVVQAEAVVRRVGRFVCPQCGQDMIPTCECVP